MKRRLDYYIRIKHGFAFESQYFAERGKYILLTPGNFYESGGFRKNIKKIKYYTGSIPEDYILHKDDLLVVMTEQAPGLLGAPALIPRDGCFLHNQRLGLIEFKKEKELSRAYLFHLFNLPSIRQEISKTAGGTKVRHTSPAKIAALEAFVPSPDAQERIAHQLSAWDSAIEKTGGLIEMKEREYSYLVSRLISIPSTRWHTYSLVQICEPVTRKNTVSETNVLTSSAEFGLISQLEYYNKSVSADDVSGYYLLKKGEFAYNRSSSKGHPYGTIKRLEKYDQGVLSTLYICFKQVEIEKCNSTFLAHYFDSGVLNQQLAEICQEGARNHGLLNISRTDFFSLSISLPEIETQGRIADILNTARKEIINLRQLNKFYLQQKSFLMSKLLTGEWEAPGSGAEAP
jgi:type I restriction enzyme S subunit